MKNSETTYRQEPEAFAVRVPRLLLVSMLFLAVGVDVTNLVTNNDVLLVLVPVTVWLVAGALLFARAFDSWKETEIHLSNQAITVVGPRAEMSIRMVDVLAVRVWRWPSWRRNRPVKVQIRGAQGSLSLLVSECGATEIEERIRQVIGTGNDRETPSPLEEAAWREELRRGDWVRVERWSPAFEVFLMAGSVFAALFFDFLALLAAGGVTAPLWNDQVRAALGVDSVGWVAVAALIGVLWLLWSLARAMTRDALDRIRQWPAREQRFLIPIERKLEVPSARMNLHFLGSGERTWQVGRSTYQRLRVGDQVLASFKERTLVELYARSLPVEQDTDFL